MISNCDLLSLGHNLFWIFAPPCSALDTCTTRSTEECCPIKLQREGLPLLYHLSLRPAYKTSTRPPGITCNDTMTFSIMIAQNSATSTHVLFTNCLPSDVKHTFQRNISTLAWEGEQTKGTADIVRKLTVSSSSHQGSA